MKKMNVAILGYGGIARQHMHGYDILEKEGVPLTRVALCDIDEKQFSTKPKINIGSENNGTAELHCYTSFDEMLQNEEIDIVDVCLPTYLHKEYTVRALRAGKHVMCEKPMALSTSDCAEMIAVAKECGKHLMIGQCLRFSSDYLALKDVLDSGTYGRVLMANFERLSILPRWGFDGWFTDFSRSGGVMHDLSIHDYDMVRFLFGEPSKVTAATVNYETKQQCSAVHMMYADGKIITVNGSWAESPSFPFTCNFHIVMEKATVTWDGKGKVRICPHDGEAFDMQYERANYMAEEVRYFAEVVLGQRKNDKNTPESAMKTIELVEKLKESTALDGAILSF